VPEYDAGKIVSVMPALCAVAHWRRDPDLRDVPVWHLAGRPPNNSAPWSWAAAFAGATP